MKKNYFEGWYFKLLGKEMTIAFIPEISTDENGRDSSSLQVVFSDRAYYFTYDYPVNMKKHLYLVLGKNVFTDTCISVNLSEENLSIKGNIDFEYCSAGKFNVMGPLKYFPMPCKHAVLLMETKLSGKLMINGEAFDFTGGKGYLEKDWGTSFPKSYMWTQCNDFYGQDIKISAAIAEIGIKEFNTLGIYACIEHIGKKYKFATYLGAKVEVLDNDEFRIRQRGLVFEGKRIKGEGQAVKLRSPENAKMTGETKEYLRCTMEYRLTKQGNEIFRQKSSRASYEYL